MKALKPYSSVNEINTLCQGFTSQSCGLDVCGRPAGVSALCIWLHQLVGRGDYWRSALVEEALVPMSHGCSGCPCLVSL